MVFHRRDLIHGAMTMGAGSMLAANAGQSVAAIPMPSRIIDSNVSLFQWPFRRLPLDEVDGLCDKLKVLRITQAWAGSFEGLLHRDLSSVNERLLKACQNRPELVPIGAINPTLPGWRQDVQRCLGTFQMPGVRLHPGYHGYALNDPLFGELLAEVSGQEGFVQIAVAMEDTRTQSPLMRVPEVDPGPLKHWMQQIPKARVQILNSRPGAAEKLKFAAIPRVVFDTSRVDGTDGVADLVRAVGDDRVLYGSHAPFLIPEAACIRMVESHLDASIVKAIMQENPDHFRRVAVSPPTDSGR